MAEGASDARDQALAPVRKGPPIPWSAPLPMPVLPGLGKDRRHIRCTRHSCGPPPAVLVVGLVESFAAGAHATPADHHTSDRLVARPPALAPHRPRRSVRGQPARPALAGF